MKKILLIYLFLLLLLGCSVPGPDLRKTSLPIVERPTLSEVSSLPPGPLTVVALGDSLTRGDGDEDSTGYPGRLWHMVNAVRPGSTMINLGQSGWTSDTLILGHQGINSELDQAVIELRKSTIQDHAAVALVWIGSNDLWYLYQFEGDVNDEGDRQNALHFSANMDLIIYQLRETGAAVFVALLDDQSKRPFASRGVLNAITQDELKRMSVQVQRYNEIISEKSVKYGAVTVDIPSTNVFIDPAMLFTDGNHPNQAGYDVLAKKWFEALSPLINR